MNSEEHSEVFVDANDQRDWPVDDSVEAFMQARFRVPCHMMRCSDIYRFYDVGIHRMQMTHLQLWVLSLPFPARVPVSVPHHIHHLCRCLLRWIPLPHTFCLCHPRTDLRQCRLFVWHRLLQSPLPDLMRRIHRILRATSRLLPRDSALLL